MDDNFKNNCSPFYKLCEIVLIRKCNLFRVLVVSRFYWFSKKFGKNIQCAFRKIPRKVV